MNLLLTLTYDFHRHKGQNCQKSNHSFSTVLSLVKNHFNLYTYKCFTNVKGELYEKENLLKKILTVIVFALLCLPAFSGNMPSNSFTLYSKLAIADDTKPGIQPLNDRPDEQITKK